MKKYFSKQSFVQRTAQYKYQIYTVIFSVFHFMHYLCYSNIIFYKFCLFVEQNKQDYSFHTHSLYKGSFQKNNRQQIFKVISLPTRCTTILRSTCAFIVFIIFATMFGLLLQISIFSSALFIYVINNFFMDSKSRLCLPHIAHIQTCLESCINMIHFFLMFPIVIDYICVNIFEYFSLLSMDITGQWGLLLLSNGLIRLHPVSPLKQLPCMIADCSVDFRSCFVEDFRLQMEVHQHCQMLNSMQTEILTCYHLGLMALSCFHFWNCLNKNGILNYATDKQRWSNIK